MNKIKLNVSFDIIEDVKKQEEFFKITNEEKQKVMQTTNFLQKHIKDIEQEIKEMFTFDDFEWVENLKVKLIEVEEEQKYNVKFKVKSSFGTVGIFLYKKGDEVLAGDNFKAYYPKEDECKLTEQEIRDFQNGDILFEHFAVKVEELEE